MSRLRKLRRTMGGPLDDLGFRDRYAPFMDDCAPNPAKSQAIVLPPPPVPLSQLGGGLGVTHQASVAADPATATLAVPGQVFLIIPMDRANALRIGFAERPALDELIAALVKHRDAVFPMPAAGSEVATPETAGP